MTKRTIRRLRLDKIAAVDLPCQEHATVAIIKRAPAGTQAIAKATFQEALEGNMIAGAVNEAFFDSFDGLWERNDAFRAALTDELAAGGDGSTASAAYVSSVKALVDEAVAAARNAGATAADTSSVDKAFTSAVENWLAAKSKEQDMTISTKAALGTAIAKFASAGVAATIGQRDEILTAAKALNAEDMLPAEGPLAKATTGPDADLVRKVAILEMPADVRKHFDALPEAEQTAFLAKDASERALIVAKANEQDPVLYTTAKGREIRKSHGQLAADLARDNDELAKKVDTLGGQLTETTIEKRAAVYPNVAKAVATAMLKSVDTLGADSEGGKAVLASLDSMNKAGGRMFKTIGATGGEGGQDEGGQVGDEAAVAEFEGAVEKAMDGGKLGRADAMTKVRRTQPELFKRAYPQPEEEEAEA